MPHAVSANCVSLYHLLVDNVKSNGRELSDSSGFGPVCDDPRRDVRVTVHAAVRKLASPNVLRRWK